MSGDELRALAEAATPSERRWPSAEFWCDHGAGYMRDAAFIAAANPTAVLALLDEVEQLRRWKAEAKPLFDGMQDLGRALDVPLGALITGPLAIEAAEALLDERDALRAQVDRVAKVLDHMVRQMHALDLGDDEETQSKLDGWAAGIGGAALVLRAALDGGQ